MNFPGQCVGKDNTLNFSHCVGYKGGESRGRREYRLGSCSSSHILLEVLVPHGDLGQLVADALVDIQVFCHTTVDADTLALEQSKPHETKLQAALFGRIFPGKVA